MKWFARLREREPALLTALALSIALATAAFFLQGHLDINLQDEGFLWYGAVHTHAGDVPMHDFRAYDPGRYYWCAAWAVLLGDGLLALRASCWIFAAVGLCFGLLAASRATRNVLLLAAVGVTFVLWMFPPWKLFECGIALVASYFAVILVEKPNVARHVLAGVVTGLAAFFGRNHGLYLAVSFAALIVFLWWKHGRPERTPGASSLGLVRRAGAWTLGIVIGYAPMLALMLFVDGFTKTFVDSILFYTRQSSLNVPLAVVWPWIPEYSKLVPLHAVSAFSLGSLFLLVPAVYVIAWIVSLRSSASSLPARALLVGSVFVGTTYVHHASVRSDVYHLAQAIHPWLLCLLAVCAAAWSTRARWLGATALAIVLAFSVLSVGLMQPWQRKRFAEGTPDAYVPCDVRGDTFVVEPRDALLVRAISQLVTNNVRAADDVWLSAKLISLYPILGRRSPIWDIYPAWEANDSDQERMTRELAAVEWIVLLDEPIGGAKGVRFPALFPKVWERVNVDFERVQTPFKGPLYFMRRRR
ncbi:MAG: hypothetical protein ACKVWV_19150 [Planctomycetota bacterium]